MYRKKWFIGLLLSLLLSIIAIILSSLNFFHNIELKSYDARFRLRGERSVDDANIAIVAIDNETYRSLPERWPFPREYHVHLIENLNEAGAKLIVFDVEFTEPDRKNPVGDQQLANAIKDAGNVIIAGKIAYKIDPHLREPIADLVTPIKPILEAGGEWGLVNETVDVDGFNRRYLLFQPLRDKIYLNLGMRALKKLKSIPDTTKIINTHNLLIYDDLTIPKYDYESMLINYYGPAKTFPTYSYSSILDDADFDLVKGEDTDYMELFKKSSIEELQLESPFQDKIVFIGASIEELHEDKFTPFYSYIGEEGKMPGVEMHAHALQTILDGNYILNLQRWIELLIIFGLGISTFFAIHRLKPFKGLLIIVPMLILYLFLAYFFFARFNYWLPIIAPLLTVSLCYVGNVVHQFLQERKEKAAIQGMFSRYVPKKVVSELIRKPELLKLGGEERFMTVIFSDVAGFTSISEKMTPTDVIKLLNEYLTFMTNIILKYEGIIDKYEGDAIMAEFGAPIYYSDHAKRACLAALQMQEKLTELRSKWKAEGKPQLKVRIGINSGQMVVGNMGSQDVFDYTVLGDAVNLGSRLEGANKVYGTYIMISERTKQELDNNFVLRDLDVIRVKGKTEPIKVYELVASDGNNLPEAKKNLLDFFHQGLEKYRMREWHESTKYLEKALEIDEKDMPSKLYIERCREFIETPPPEDWDGVYTMTHK
jgi:adenylate cyclase